mmetsp:Transcript_1982/g.2835  ORF Transcript_1982/g.2835 Transcript_1982/m.2835 type:complete len:344 (+) Transcript_1982:161-1192(+)
MDVAFSIKTNKKKRPLPGFEKDDSLSQRTQKTGLQKRPKTEKAKIVIPLQQTEKKSESLLQNTEPTVGNDAEYSKVPIADFGAAMLRGMGWDPKKNKGVSIVEAKPRISRLGLGAEPKPPEKGDRDWLCIGARVRFKSGKFEKQKGEIVQMNGMIGDSVLVQLDPDIETGKGTNRIRVSISRKALEIIPKKTKAKQRPEPQERSVVKEDLKEKKSKKKKKRDRDRKRVFECWVVPGIRVRVVSRSVSDGVYYAKKGVVTMVTDPTKGQCLVQMDNPRAIIPINQNKLQTCLAVGKPVRVLRGIHKNRIGTLLEKQKRKEVAVVSVEDEILKQSFDDVAEVVPV